MLYLVLNMYKQIFTLLILLFLNTCAQAQVFSKFYDYKGINDFSSQLILIPNSNYITLSASVDLNSVDTFNFAKTYWFFVKVNSNGDTLKTKVYTKKHFALGTSGSTSVRLKSNQNLHVGEIINLIDYKLDTIGSDIHVVFFDDNLDTIKTKIIRLGLGDESTVDVLKSSDGNIVIFGQNCTQGRPIQDCNYFLMKLDSNLNVLWTNSYTYGTTYFENPTAFVETADKDFLLFGYTGKYISQNTLLRYWYLVKTDSLGNRQWQKIFKLNDFQSGFGITKALDGNYLLSGSVETIITGGAKKHKDGL